MDNQLVDLVDVSELAQVHTLWYPNDFDLSGVGVSVVK